MKKVYKVGANETGNRLDAWLCKRLPGTSRNSVKRLIDSGSVRVGGRRIYIAGWKLNSNDRVEISEGPAKAKGGSYVKIIYEDRDIIVVDKPAGVLSVPQPKSSMPNLEDQVKAYLKRKYKTGSYLKALHRLDAETSGAIVFAKSKDGERLEESFRRHDIGRDYLAVVEGHIEKDSGRIEGRIEKGRFGGGRKARPAKGAEGRVAVTEYRVKERYSGSTLLEISVRTGRTHQIRVHLSHMGNPVIGDKLYGATRPFPRQALHARYLRFRHPVTGKKMKFESRVPDDINALIDELRCG